MAHKYKCVLGIQVVQHEEGTNPMKTSVDKFGNIAFVLKLSCIGCLFAFNVLFVLVIMIFGK